MIENIFKEDILINAAKNGDFDTVDSLFADMNFQDKTQIIRTLSPNVKDMIMLKAVEYNNENLLKLCIEADININDSIMQKAITLNRASIIKLFIETGAYVDDFIMDSDTWSKLQNEEEQQFKAKWISKLLDRRVTKLVASAESVLEKFSEENKLAVIDALRSSSDIKFKRNDNQPFSVIKDINDQYFALLSPKGVKKDDNILGKGLSGRVKLAHNLLTHEWCAVKISGESGAHEASFLKDMQLYQGEQKNIDTGRFYLFMNYVPGIQMSSFVEELKSDKEMLSKKQQAIMLLEILQQIKKMIEMEIIHSDLQGINVMINPVDLKVTFIDYGFSFRSNMETVAYIGGKEVQHYYDINNIISYTQSIFKDPDLCAIINSFPVVPKPGFMATLKQISEIQEAVEKREQNVLQTVDTAIKNTQQIIKDAVELPKNRKNDKNTTTNQNRKKLLFNQVYQEKDVKKENKKQEENNVVSNKKLDI